MVKAGGFPCYYELERAAQAGSFQGLLGHGQIPLSVSVAHSIANSPRQAAFVKAEVAAEGIQGRLGDQLGAVLRRQLPSEPFSDLVCSAPERSHPGHAGATRS